MEHRYNTGDLVYNVRDKTYNLVVDVIKTLSNHPNAKYLYKYIDLDIGIQRSEFVAFYEERVRPTL